ncbi:MAG: hypothetical protein NZM34_13640 [Bernardetiaceae bacterium]|nr:hypothetical protein [Bernardetiaceae bacterium]
MQEITIRRIILNLYNQGDTQKKITEATGFTQGRVSQIISEEKRGHHGDNWGSHKPCKLTDEQLEDLQKYIASGAEAHGFVGAHWSRLRLKQLIWDKLGVSYYVNGVYLLRRLG